MTATTIRPADQSTAQDDFDPLVDLAGLWTLELARQHLPIPSMLLAKYECWDGRLYVAPHEQVEISFGEMKLGRILAAGAERSGYFVCGPVNLEMGTPGRWIQPDITIIDTLCAARGCGISIVCY